MKHSYSRLWAGRGVAQIGGGLIVRDFPKISDPRLMRDEIARAHICDKMPIMGIVPATLALSAQTLTRLTKCSGGLDFSAPERWLSFLTRFRQEEIPFV